MVSTAKRTGNYSLRRKPIDLTPFTRVADDAQLTWLEKGGQAGGATTQEQIEDALEEYARLFKAGIASNAEKLTLARAFPDAPTYTSAIKDISPESVMVIGGPASIEMVDKEGHLIKAEALDRAFKKYMDNFRTRNAMVLHSDVQVGWALPAYITKGGQIYKSGVREKELFFICELRDDTRIAERVAKQIEDGKLRSYSIAGSATKVQNVQKGLVPYMQVDDMELAEVTVCEKGVNQGASFQILKAQTGKISKDQCGYRPATDVEIENNIMCGTCKYYSKDDKTCDTVDGIFEDTDYCKLFEAEEEEQPEKHAALIATPPKIKVRLILSDDGQNIDFNKTLQELIQNPEWSTSEVQTQRDYWDFTKGDESMSITKRLLNLHKQGQIGFDTPSNVTPSKGRGAAAMGGAVNPAMGNPELELADETADEDLLEQLRDHPRWGNLSEERLRSFVDKHRGTAERAVAPPPTEEEIQEQRKNNPILQQIYANMEQRRKDARIYGEEGEEKVPRSRAVKDKSLKDAMRFHFKNPRGDQPQPYSEEAWGGTGSEKEEFTPGVGKVIPSPGAGNEMSRRMNEEMARRKAAGPSSDPSGREDKGIFAMMKQPPMEQGDYASMQGRKGGHINLGPDAGPEPRAALARMHEQAGRQRMGTDEFKGTGGMTYRQQQGQKPSTLTPGSSEGVSGTGRPVWQAANNPISDAQRKTWRDTRTQGGTREDKWADRDLSYLDKKPTGYKGTGGSRGPGEYNPAFQKENTMTLTQRLINLIKQPPTYEGGAGLRRKFDESYKPTSTVPKSSIRSGPSPSAEGDMNVPQGKTSRGFGPPPGDPGEMASGPMGRTQGGAVQSTPTGRSRIRSGPSPSAEGDMNIPTPPIQRTASIRTGGAPSSEGDMNTTPFTPPTQPKPSIQSGPSPSSMGDMNAPAPKKQQRYTAPKPSIRSGPSPSGLGEINLMEKSFTQRLLALHKANSDPFSTGEAFTALENTEARVKEHEQLLREYGFPNEIGAEANRYIPVVETETDDKGIPIHLKGPWVVNEAGNDVGELLDEDAPSFSASEKAHNREGKKTASVSKSYFLNPPTMPFLSKRSM